MADNEQIMLMLGEIRGELKGMNTQLGTMQGQLKTVDERLRHNEIKAAANGVVAGGATALGITLIIEGAKAFFRGHGT